MDERYVRRRDKLLHARAAPFGPEFFPLATFGAKLRHNCCSYIKTEGAINDDARASVPVQCALQATLWRWLSSLSRWCLVQPHAS